MRALNVTLPCDVVGMYLTDTSNLLRNAGGASFWKTDEGSRYIPILTMFDLRHNGDLKFTTGEDVSDDITTYNQNTRPYKLDEGVVKRSRLDVTINDLLLGGVNVVLNFTKHNLTLSTRFGLPKMYVPLENTKFSDFAGKVLIMTVYTLNSPIRVRDVYGYSNYIESLRKKYAGRNDSSVCDLNKVLDYVLACWSTTKTLTDTMVSDTIKVATVTTLSERDFLVDGKRRDVYIRNKDVSVSLLDIYNAAEHPALTSGYVQDANVVSTLRANGISCFIVDNDDQIGDRYYNFAGTVKKIPKLRDRDKPEGLHVVTIDGSQNLSVESVIALDKIDENRYIFKSQEDAQDGSDLRSRYTVESEIRKIERNDESLELKRKHEEEIRRIEQESLRRKAEHEEMVRNMELRHSEALRAMKEKMEGNKFEYDVNRFHMDNAGLYRKNHYEETKYHRDSTVETIKTIGAVSSLVLGSYVLYSKFNK